MTFREKNCVVGTESLKPQKASTTLTKGTLGVYDADGLVVACTATSTYADVLVLQTQTAWAGETPDVLVADLDVTSTLYADCTNAVAQDQVGNLCELTDASTVNNTAADGTNNVVRIIWLSDITDQVVECRPIVRG